jgi:Rrf2 family protein
MFITRECDYAVRVIRALADEPRLSVNEICEQEAITAPFAYKILKKLQKAKIVKGYRGVHGGYKLNIPSDHLTLYDVYSAIDPDMFIIECMNPYNQCIRNGQGADACRVHGELSYIQQEVWNLLKRKSLAQVFSGEEGNTQEMVSGDMLHPNTLNHHTLNVNDHFA